MDNIDNMYVCTDMISYPLWELKESGNSQSTS